MRELNPTLTLAFEANNKIQGLFRERAKLRLVIPAQGLFMDQYQVPCLRHYNEVLKQTMEGSVVSTQVLLKDNVDKLERLASYIDNILSDHPDTNISQDERELLGDYRHIVLA